MSEQSFQKKRQEKRTGSIVMMVGGGLILLDLIIFIVMYAYLSRSFSSTTYGVAEGAGMAIAYITVFVVFPLAAIGAILVVVGLVINLIRSSISRRKQMTDLMDRQ
jgi:hypothetical protein